MDTNIFCQLTRYARIIIASRIEIIQGFYDTSRVVVELIVDELLCRRSSFDGVQLPNRSGQERRQLHVDDTDAAQMP